MVNLDAAVLIAEMNVPHVRQGGKEIDMFPVVYLENEPKEEEKLWTTDSDGRVFTFRSHTEEEREEMRLNEAYKLERMFEFILKHYGWKYAEGFYDLEQWREEFDKYGIVPDLNIPHCLYEKDCQCDIECPFFKGYCTYTYKEEK